MKPRPATTWESLRPKPASNKRVHGLSLLEVCAYPGSALAHEWALNGKTAVRIAHRKSNKKAKAGPDPVAGRAQTWYLDLTQKEDRRLVTRNAAKHRPEDLWTSPECRCFTSMQRVNNAVKTAKGKRAKKWRPRGEKEVPRIPCQCEVFVCAFKTFSVQAIDMLRWMRNTLHKRQKQRGGRSHHEQSAVSRLEIINLSNVH